MQLRKARVYLSGVSFYNKALAFYANIRIGWKALPGTNTLAYLASLAVM